ncbi:MAG: hypothetical protein IJ894_01505, partial [Bacteroidales bacterium]|nr:hypothetical protein [Bacteroidales bacterium]
AVGTWRTTSLQNIFHNHTYPAALGKFFAEGEGVLAHCGAVDDLVSDGTGIFWLQILGRNINLVFAIGKCLCYDLFGL